jgi:hypothetical protein
MRKRNAYKARKCHESGLYVDTSLRVTETGESIFCSSRLASLNKEDMCKGTHQKSRRVPTWRGVAALTTSTPLKSSPKLVSEVS